MGLQTMFRTQGVAQNRTALRQALLGAILGAGAPLGYFVYSYLLLNPLHVDFGTWCLTLWRDQTLLMDYLTLPTMAVFAAFGYISGRQQEKLAFKTHQMESFLDVAAHDIKTPLSTVKEASSQLEDGLLGKLTQPQNEFIKMIGRQAEVIQELVEELLDIHKMESGKYALHRQDLKPLALVDRAVREQRLALDKVQAKVEIRSGLPDELRMQLDRFRIRQVFRNFISNAIKHMPKGGALAIELFQPNAREVEMTFFNEGPQIPEEKLPLIFDKFAQAKDRDQKLGVGLGLAICKNIIELHAGRIWVENRAPSGVCFHIRLPV